MIRKIEIVTDEVNGNAENPEPSKHGRCRSCLDNIKLKVSSNKFLLCYVTLIVVSGKFPFHTIIMTSWLVELNEK